MQHAKSKSRYLCFVRDLHLLPYFVCASKEGSGVDVLVNLLPIPYETYIRKMKVSMKHTVLQTFTVKVRKRANIKNQFNQAPHLALYLAGFFIWCYRR